MRLHCLLCGVRLFSQTISARPLEPGERLDWRRELRAVKSEQESQSPTLTGIGYCYSRSLRASLDANVSYVNSRHDLKQHRLFHASSPTQTWTFAFHEACWQVLLSQVESLTGLRQDPLQIAEILFNLLLCVPRDRFHIPFPEHDFGGAYQFWGISSDIPGTWGYVYADPNIPRDFPWVALHAGGGTDLFQGFYDEPSDPFTRLPLEVNHLILEFLQSSDLCNLRLSSRKVAGLAKPTRLPQSFWTSRFAADKEMSFFPLRECLLTSWPSTIDRRELYLHIKHALQDRTSTGHVRNRRRIWQCLGHFTQCLVPLLEQKPRLRDGNSIEPELAALGYQVGQLAKGAGRKNLAEWGDVGIRLLGTQSLLFSAEILKDEGIEISVSFITFNCAEYVCGMKILGRHGGNDVTELARVGLIMPRSEEAITIPKGTRFTGIQVASSVSGIVGIGFLTQRGDGPIIPKTAGIINRLPDGVGIAALHPRTGYELSGLMVGLDACKFVSVQLLELQAAPALSEDSTERADPWFWHPAKPDFGDKSTSFDMPPANWTLKSPGFALDMNFGGPDGTRLSHLNRIAAFHDHTHGYLRGFSFFYTDGSEEAFGMRKIMITNFGRTLEFQRWRQSFAEAKIEYECLVPPPGKAMTGILAAIQVLSGAIQTLGLRCMADVPDMTHDSPPKLRQPHRDFSDDTDHCGKTPWLLQHPGNCFTSVGFSNIRRIGLSAGIPGKTRDPCHVSGLCFEFWDSRETEYVGQWFREVGSFCLGPGERITSITFWQAQESDPLSYIQENNGRVTGIEICKSGLEEKEFSVCFGNRDEMLVSSFTENLYEELDGLVWNFDHWSDYVYVLTRPPKSRPEIPVLQLYNMSTDWPSSRMPGRLFWLAQDEHGNRLHVSGIHAFFDDIELSGIMFEYGDGQIRRHVGRAEGDRCSMSIEEGERITAIDSRLGLHCADSIRFYTSKNRVCALQIIPDDVVEHEDSDTDSPDEPNDSTELRILFSEGTLATPTERYGEEFVGLWVTMKIPPRAPGLIEKLGPILLESPED